MLLLSAFERSLLDDISRAAGGAEAGLRAIMATARVVERDVNGHGYYVRFEVDAALPWPPCRRPVEGPYVEARTWDGLVLRFGCLLWPGPRPQLEVYQCGSDLDLREIDLMRVSLVVGSH